MQKFKVSDYITLKLEDNKTNIYINGEKFRQCKYLLLNISYNKVSSLDEIDSIDEIAQSLGHSLELPEKTSFKIPPEVEFWGHCSNLQVWIENNYDTRLLRSNLAFPLLKKLTEIGDPTAKKVFKDEIINRFLSYELTVIQFLIEGKYLKYFKNNEIEILMDEMGEYLNNLTNKEYIRYLNIIAKEKIVESLLVNLIRNIVTKLKDLSVEQVLDLLNSELDYSIDPSDLFKMLLKDDYVSKLLFSSLTSKNYELQKKTIHLLSWIEDLGIKYLIKWFPFAVRRFSASNFRNTLFYLSNSKLNVKPHKEMVEFIAYQIIHIKKYNFTEYNTLMDVLEGIKFLYGVILPRDFIEIPTDVFFNRFNKYYKQSHLDYKFYGGDEISQFEIIPKEKCYYYDLVKERMPIKDFTRGQNDAYRELKKVILPRENLIIFHFGGGWEGAPYGLSVGMLHLNDQVKKWVNKIKLILKQLEFDKFHKALMKELRLLLIDTLSYPEKLKILYFILDYIIYERYPIEIRYIDSYIFHKKIEDYYKNLNTLIEFERSIDWDVSFTVYPEGQKYYYKSDLGKDKQNNQVLRLLKNVFFPKENLKILNLYKIQSYVFYVKKKT